MLKIAEYRKVLSEDGKSVRIEKIYLKELEKFGFKYEEFNDCYTNEIKEDTEISVFCNNRAILVTYWSGYEIKEADDMEITYEELKQYCPDLIEAGIVEKVVES